MAFIDINKLIMESIETKLASTSNIDLSESYLNTVVDEITKNKTIKLEDIKNKYSNIFESEDKIKQLYDKLTNSNVIIEGFNDDKETDTDATSSEKPMSPIAGVIGSAISVRKYLKSENKTSKS